MGDFKDNLLFKKIHGYVAAGSVGNSMGELPEGYTVEERQQYWGYIDYLPEVTKHTKRLFSVNDRAANPYDTGLGHPKVGRPHTRVPGTTEDGEERFRILSTAIIEKGGRIDIVDLAKIWVRDVTPDMFGWQVGSQDQVIYYSLKAGVPPWEVGRYASWPGLYGTTKMIGAVGVVNACYPEQAMKDGMELARIKDVRGVPGNYAIEVAGAHCAGVATALMPNATVDMVIQAAANVFSPTPKREFMDVLEIAQKCGEDFEEYGKKLQYKYENRQVSNAVEILSAAYGILHMTKGDPRKAILFGVNSGRDTDCRAHTAGSLAGAINGIDAVPADWVKTVDDAMKVNEHTASNRTSFETAEGLYKAAMNNIDRMRKVIADIDSYTS
ncbi:MAG: ADP-ribosylglycohydrolase family protein [Christensenellales bacterium]|jgi:ADP-ribosylglycohydrolase